MCQKPNGQIEFVEVVNDIKTKKCRYHATRIVLNIPFRDYHTTVPGSAENPDPEQVHVAASHAPCVKCRMFKLNLWK